MKQNDEIPVQPEIPVNEPVEPEQTPNIEIPPVVEPEQTPTDTEADIVV